MPTAHVQGRVARAIDGTQLSRACPADRPFNREALCWVELLRDGGTAYEQRILERRVQRRVQQREAWALEYILECVGRMRDIRSRRPLFGRSGSRRRRAGPV